MYPARASLKAQLKQVDMRLKEVNAQLKHVCAAAESSGLCDGQENCRLQGACFLQQGACAGSATDIEDLLAPSSNSPIRVAQVPLRQGKVRRPTQPKVRSAVVALGVRCTTEQHQGNLKKSWRKLGKN